MQPVKEINLKKKKKNTSDFYKKNCRQLSIMAFLPILHIFVFCYIPMFGIIIAFKNFKFNKGILASDWVGLNNFKFFVSSNDFARITRNTLVNNGLIIVVGMAAAVVLATLLFSVKSRLCTKIVQTVYITPNFVSWVTAAVMLYTFLEPQNGFINRFLIQIGLQPVKWYSEPDYWPFILLIASIWKHIGMDSILYYAALMGVDTSIFEAADVDGAGRLTKFFHITVPQLVPVITIQFILAVGRIFNADFGLFYQMTLDSGQLYKWTDVISTYNFRVMKVVGNMSLSAAVGVLQSVVGFVLVIITNKITKTLSEEGGLF